MALRWGIGKRTNRIGGAAPPWVIPGASLDMNFASGLYWSGPGNPTGAASLVTCTRGQTVSSYAQWADGHWSAFAANTLRITDKGALIEQQATNQCLWGRDFTNAAWVATTMTAAMDQVGIDNVANSASSLLATGPLATVIQTTGLGSASTTFSVFLKRITGTGTVKISVNGSVFSSDLSGSLSPTAWFRASITATASPVLAVQLGTSGDKIAVDMAQDETGSFSTSPIPTTTVSVLRNGDNPVFAGVAATAVLAANAAYFQTFGIFGTAITNRLFEINTSGQKAYFNSTTVVNVNNGTTDVSATFGSGTNAGAAKIALGFDGTSVTGIVNGGTPATGAIAWGATSGTVYLGRAAANHALNGYMLHLAFGPTKGMFDGLTA